jgi:hypothetical protein
MDEEEEESFEAFADGTGRDRSQVARELSDHQLLHYYDRLHHPDFIDDLWIPILEEEIRRRGLRPPS